jgi:hypothetical protein
MSDKEMVNSFLDAITEYIESSFSTVILRRIIIPQKNGVITAYLFVPIQFKGFILQKDLSRSSKTYIDIIDQISDELGHSFGDAGIIKMSYIMKGFDEEHMYVSDDKPITSDIYNKLGSVSYAKLEIKFS